MSLQKPANNLIVALSLGDQILIEIKSDFRIHLNYKNGIKTDFVGQACPAARGLQQEGEAVHLHSLQFHWILPIDRLINPTLPAVYPRNAWLFCAALLLGKSAIHNRMHSLFWIQKPGPNDDQSDSIYYLGCADILDAIQPNNSLTKHWTGQSLGSGDRSSGLDGFLLDVHSILLSLHK